MTYSVAVCSLLVLLLFRRLVDTPLHSDTKLKVMFTKTLSLAAVQSLLCKGIMFWVVSVFSDDNEAPSLFFLL